MEDIKNEIENISPLIAGIGKRNVYSVPEGYFDKEPELSFLNRRTIKQIFFIRYKKIISYAAAAIIAIALITTGINQLTLKEVTISQKISKLDDTEIIDYLNTQPVITEFTSTNSNDNEIYFQNTVENFDDTEIQEYLLTN